MSERAWKFESSSGHQSSLLANLADKLKNGIAQVAELVDALASGASVRKGVEVRVFFWAPNSEKARLYKSGFFYACFLLSLQFRMLPTVYPSLSVFQAAGLWVLTLPLEVRYYTPLE